MSRLHALAGFPGRPLWPTFAVCTSSPTHPLDPPAVRDAVRGTLAAPQRRWCAATIAELEHSLARHADAPAGG